MNDYIDREALKEVFEEDGHLSAYVEEMIDSIPAADVRPMVTCADCKHWDVDWVPNYAKENEHFCPIVALTIRGDWFCADGEKRKES